MKIAKDHTGVRYGRLMVIERVFNDYKKDVTWKCLCDCGNYVNVLGGNLKRTNSCGCIITENRKHKNIIGLKNGKLTIIEEMTSVRSKTTNYRMVLCRCDCGNLISKRLTAMFYESDRSGDSCGCLKSESRQKRERRKPDYGIRKHPIYEVWQSMRARCYNKNTKSYHRYGGRGIIICGEWKKSFVPFYNWSILNGYKKDLTIDRINNDGNYEPSNCRYATALIQANNRSKTTYVILNGEKIAISLACRKLGLRTATIRQRMFRDGHSFDDAIKMSLKKAS